jgi:serralysin
VPGPSPALFAAPFYQCTRNFYVATTGNDANDGSSARPWATVQHANDAGRAAGDCVNVQPGTYNNSFWTVTHGGNLASSTGYVVYRCATLNGCIMSDGNGAKVAVGTNYVVFDGFDFAASSAITYGIGINVWDDGGSNSSNHHIWAINNKIHGYGQSGIQFNDGDYYFSIHNAAYDNSHVTCDAQGSGISYVVEKAAPGYVPTAQDAEYAPFHHVVAWNDVHDNMLTTCGTASNAYDTDGNGIIMDTFSNAGGTNVDYPYQSLVAFNVTYKNGGGGVHIFLSNHVTVANNTAYDNHLDPANNGTYRPEIGVNNNGLKPVTAPSNVFIDNIAYAIVGTGYLSCNAAFSAGGAGGDASFQNNVSYVVGKSCNGDNPTWNGDTFSCSTNKCATDPLWVTTGSNFALQSTSPAIGYGETQSYLSAQSVDVGACDHRLTACP